jgi:DNA invertase Pin-like site-specific DNA recombinase
MTARGTAVANSVLTEDLVREIRRLKAEGYGARKIAKILGLNRYTVRNVINDATWAWVT